MSTDSGDRRLTSSEGEFALKSGKKQSSTQAARSAEREEARQFGFPTINSLSLLQEKKNLAPVCLSEVF